MKNSNSIDNLVFSAVFSPDINIKKSSRLAIRQLAEEKGINLASINDFYMSVGRGEAKGFTVPAINIRFLTYDTARVLFSLIKKRKIGPLIFEIARSEIKYTDQRPDEYVTVILAAAIKENYQGPVFIQGDHYQFSLKKYTENAEKETKTIKNLIKESIKTGFYNIDIDASTLVDLSKKNLDEQQKNNYQMTALLTKYIREIQTADVTVSIGGEIGHIGGKNSNVGDFTAFMEGYLKEVKSQKSNNQNVIPAKAGIHLIDSRLRGNDNQGISKVSVQTGTSHGGIPMADGTIAKVNLDFDVLESIGRVAREKYQIGGAVQHGASTLPNELFDRFPKTKTLEIHLATGFQNIVFEKMPKKLKEEINDWLRKNCADEKKPDQTNEQFIYKTRKKAAGPFKKKLWEMTPPEKKPIVNALAKQFESLFEKLNVINTRKFFSN